MGKRKAVPPPDVQPEKDNRVTVLNLKGTREYKQWLDELSEFSHMPTSTLFDVSIADWAKRQGFSKTPPKRQRV